MTNTNTKATLGGVPCEMGPSWSPDGSRIAYECLSDSTDYCGNQYWSLWVMRRDGGQRRDVVTGALTPAWSPDGTHFVFYDNNNEIATVRVGGSGEEELTHSQRRSYYSPDWQPRLRSSGRKPR